MSQANVEFVRNFYLSKLAVMKTLVTPDVVFDEAGGVPWSGQWRGPDGLEQLMLTINKSFKCTMHSQDIHDLGGDLVLRLAAVEFRNRETGQAMVNHMNEVHRLRDGKVVEVDVFYKDPAGIAALLPAPA